MKLNEFNKNLKKEYYDTFEENVEIKPKRQSSFSFKLRYLLFALPALIVLLFVSIVLIDDAQVNAYNNNIDDRMNSVLNNTSKDLEKVNSKNDLNSKLASVDFSPRESFLDSIVSIFEDKKGFMDNNFATGGDVADDAPAPGNPGMDAPTMDGNNSFETNIQTEGVAEADSAKCDGTYIYAIQDKGLYIYNLSGILLASQPTNATQLYLYNDKIVLLENSKTIIYSFNGSRLIDSKAFYHGRMVESRLVNNMLYLVVSDKLNVNTEDCSNLYYDGCINPYYVYSIISYDLDTDTAKNIKLVNSYDAILYASKKHFYLASVNYINGTAVTFISIVDIDLNPVGVVRLKGTVLNQFSLDEANGYLRVVSTDTSKTDNELNSISIFDLASLQRVGYLNKGIGKSNQRIKSARFEGNICYVVTYLTQDPLYEIDCSDPTNPYIVDFYESPGYSSYLHTFEINDKSYLFGLGYTDFGEPKLSIYYNDEDLTQIGKDLVFGVYYSYIEKTEYTYECRTLVYNFLSDHKALFVYNDNTYLYLGFAVGREQYVIFKIDVNNEEMPISVYKEYKDLNYDYKKARGFLVNDKFYIVTIDDIIIDDWK